MKSPIEYNTQVNEVQIEQRSTYKQAGVDIDAGEELVRRIKPMVRSTFSERVLTDIGGFGGLYDARFPEMKFPVLVSSTDGVGTKLKVAVAYDKHDTVGHDLVNHCVNDILVCGARPLFFLDYFASGKLRVEVGEAIVSGFVRGCKENGCALIGGETAEMPGLYDLLDYDLAGTVVGIVERSRMLGREHVQRGDVLIGIASNGLHTNGYSLARKVLFSKFSTLDTPAELCGKSVAEALLEVHRSYLNIIQEIYKSFAPVKDIHALAHITGGGLAGNTSRILGEGMALSIDWDSWDEPAIFGLIRTSATIPEEDMRRTFNLGIGLVIVAAEAKADGILEVLKAAGEGAWRIGSVV